MPASGLPAYHRSRARLRRIMERLSFRIRLVLSHVMVLLLALLAINVAADVFGRRLADAGISEVQALMIELTGKGEGSIDFRMILPALIIGMITALVCPWCSPGSCCGRSTGQRRHPPPRRGHYDDVLNFPASRASQRWSRTSTAGGGPGRHRAAARPAGLGGRP